MDSDTVWRHIDRERAEFCDTLETLTAEQWASDSLCAGWTVRDVAAHLTLSQARLRQVAPLLISHRFRVNAMIHDSAIESPLSHAEIIDIIRGFVGSRRRAPFVGEIEPLLDILIHSQDICVPLGIDRPMPLDAAVVSIERVLRLNRGPFRLRRPFRNVRLVATDTEWSNGRGRVVTGPARWLLMLVAGRDVARQHLSGAIDEVSP